MNRVLPHIGLILTLCLLAADFACANEPIEIPPSQAVSVAFDKPDETAPHKTLIQLSNRSWMDEGIATFDVPLIAFDLSDIPPDAKISKAILRLVPYGIGSTDTRPVIRVYPIQAEWNETEVTWNSKPAWDEGFLEIEILPESNEWKPWEIDITPLVTQWLRGSIPNHGVAIVAESTKGDLHNFAFFGRNTTDGRAPKLLITLD